MAISSSLADQEHIHTYILPSVTLHTFSNIQLLYCREVMRHSKLEESVMSFDVSNDEGEDEDDEDEENDGESDGEKEREAEEMEDGGLILVHQFAS